MLLVVFSLLLVVFLILRFGSLKVAGKIKKFYGEKATGNLPLLHRPPASERDLKKAAYEKVPDAYKKYVSSIAVADGHARVSFSFEGITSEQLQVEADELKRAMHGTVVNIEYDGKTVDSKYQKVLGAFERYIAQFSFIRKVIDAISTVYVVEDSAIFLVQLARANSDDFYGHPFAYSSTEERRKTVITELTYNGVFDFAKSRFEKELGFYHFVEFIGYGYYGSRSAEQLYVERHLPEVGLFRRLEARDGVPYNFIVFETTGDDGEIGRACYHTQSPLVTKEAHRVASEMQNAIAFDYKCCVNRRDGMYECIEKAAGEVGATPEKEWLICTTPKSAFGDSNALRFRIDSNFKRIMFERIARMKDASCVVLKDGRAQFFNENVKWFSFNRGIKNLLNAPYENVDYEILKEIARGSYHCIERQKYVPLVGRWKNEELMFRCVQNVFKGQPVVYQHRPFFLGRQSYDVYVPGDDIAFEYQGKQHFAPVAFFGGEEGYRSQVERDDRKRRLSKENGITVIYVNYWEDVSEDLIRQKLIESGVSGAIPGH